MKDLKQRGLFEHTDRMVRGVRKYSNVAGVGHDFMGRDRHGKVVSENPA